MKITIDFETRSTADIGDLGQIGYAKHPSTQVLCLAVKPQGKVPMVWLPPWMERKYKILFRDESLRWRPEILTPRQLQNFVGGADAIEAHNAAFEFAIWNQHMPFPLPIEKLHCSAAKAAMHGLPRSLGQACLALGLADRKDSEGRFLMLKMCKPQKGGTWLEDLESLKKLISYCKKDVIAEEALSSRLDELPPMERKIYIMDHNVNSRGAQIDRNLAEAAIALGDQHKRIIEKEFTKITGIPTPGCVAQILVWAFKFGVRMPDLTKASVQAAMEDQIPPEVRRVLEIRQSWGKTSVAKYKSLLDRIEGTPDDRARDLFLYHAATTGRWGGQGFQPQNLPSRSQVEDVAGAVEAIKAGATPDEIELFWGDPMAVLSSCIRGCIVAPPGKDLIVADYSAIEARVLAWLVGEEWVLAAYRNKEDLYIRTAGAIFGKAEETVTKSERQIGKVAVLACIAEGQKVLTDTGEKCIEQVSLEDKVWDGVDFVSHEGVVYQGMQEVIEYDGIKATADHRVFVEAPSGACVELPFGLAASSGSRIVRSGHCGCPLRVGGDTIPREAIPARCYDILSCGPRNRFTVNGRLVHNCGYAGGKAAFAAMAKNYGIHIEEAKAQEIVKAWRESRPATVKFWKTVEHAAQVAVRSPGEVVTCGRVTFLVKGDFLTCRLPSGRSLYYPFPKLGTRTAPWGDEVTSLLFMGVDQGRWVQLDTHGGRLTENIVQAIARDLLAEALVRLENHIQYSTVLHVHDEIVAECPEGEGDVDEFCKFICALPVWAKGLPLEAEGKIMKRYAK